MNNVRILKDGAFCDFCNNGVTVAISMQTNKTICERCCKNIKRAFAEYNVYDRGGVKK